MWRPVSWVRYCCAFIPAVDGPTLRNLEQLVLRSARRRLVYFGQALTSKTTMSAESKARFLPFIGIGTGLSQRDWASIWLRARSSEQLIFSSFALPSFFERSGTWTSSLMSASEAIFWLREFTQLKFGEISSRDIGSHSCKFTLLTWAGRTFFTPSERRL